MKFSAELLLATLLLPRSASALYQEDAGVLDFLVETSGHTVTRFVDKPFEGSVLTSDTLSSESKPTSCYVASRSVEDGSLLWRRNVCATSSADQTHDIASQGEYFYTIDNGGSVRAWTKRGGELLWDTRVSPSSQPKVWTFSKQGMDFVIAASNEELSIFHADTGKLFDDPINVVKALGQSVKNGEHVEWLAALPDPTDAGRVRSIVSFAKEDDSTSGNRMIFVELEIGNDQIVSHKSLGHVKGSIVASSVQLQLVGDSWHGVALATDGTPVHFSVEKSQFARNLSPSQLHPEWQTVSAVRPTSISSVISLQGGSEGSQDSSSLFRFDEAAGNWVSHGMEDFQFIAFARCAEADLEIGLSSDALRVYRQGKPMTLTGDIFVPDGDIVEQFSILECSSDKATALLSTSGGTTTQLTFQVNGDMAVEVAIGWSVEEGLGSVSSAVILDASHLGLDDLIDEQDAVMEKLSFPSRLSSQLSNILSTVTGKGGTNRRDHLFGFVKIAALLSQESHRVWGLSTSGEDRGSVQWSLDLPKTAVWHTLVHGTTNSANVMHGINGGTHSREILVLSASESSVEWKCIDGTTGAVNSQDTVSISSPVVQVLPMYGGAGGCRQGSLLLHQDQTISTVPGDKETTALVDEQLRHTPNGLYTHIVDKEASKVVSFQVAGDSADGFAARQVGQASFAGERIVKVAYPIRDETVQSMSTVLGDDSLLLKYINPHMAVVITMSEDESQGPTKIATSVEKQQGMKKTRKPAGAGDSADQVTPTSIPNMFVNVIDTVSGRVLHRAGHANADPSRDTTALISENWILYSFINAVTRRTELGVLTLHEGMIDKKGMTMFSSAEQTTTFSSFDARESKPVVLAKVYVYPKAVTALGATATRGGISSRKILIATADGKVTAIDRNMLETRRPMGEVKEAEKKEGLVP
jgi:hypothetical protein